MMFFSEWDDGKERMVKAAHRLLNTADVVMHFNGIHFDVPYLNKEFLLLGLTPPSPYRQIDLYREIRKKFRFPSNKLDYVSRVLGLEGKIHHSGHDLWVRVMAGDEVAREEMRAYNERDVRLLEEMYAILLPWIGHPNRAIGEDRTCTRCGSTRLIGGPSYYSEVSQFPSWRCLSCGGYMRETKRTQGASLKSL